MSRRAQMVQKVGDWLFAARQWLDRRRDQSGQAPVTHELSGVPMTPVKLLNWIRQDSRVSTVIALAFVVGTAGFVYWAWVNRGRVYIPTGVFYYDLGTEKLFTGQLSDMPPVPAPSGFKQADGADGGVRAHVYACGNCSDPSKQFIAYLETTTPPVRELVAKMRELAIRVQSASADAAQPSDQSGSPSDAQLLIQMREEAQNGQLIALPQKPIKWVPVYSEEGIALVRDHIETKCEGGRAMECRP